MSSPNRTRALRGALFGCGMISEYHLRACSGSCAAATLCLMSCATSIHQQTRHDFQFFDRDWMSHAIVQLGVCNQGATAKANPLRARIDARPRSYSKSTPG